MSETEHQPHIMLLAGESSGDQHGAEMAHELRKLNPNIKLTGMGSQAMRQADIPLVYDSASIAVVGIVEIIKHWGDIKIAMNAVKRHLETEKPDLLVCIDYPEFNLKMAKHAKSLGIKVLFYISPQVWAWRPKRVKKIGERIDHMAVIFPFEVNFYNKHNIPVTYVGHPLTDKVVCSLSQQEAKNQFSLNPKKYTVGLFPGSRNSEISRLLPTFLDSAQLLKQQFGEAIEFVLPVASTLDKSSIEEQVKQTGLSIQLISGDLYPLIKSCDAIMTCSGTVTLEIALIGTPLCVAYKMSWLSHQIMTRLMIIDQIALVNIVAQKLLAKEFLQNEANPQNISNEITRILTDKGYRQSMQTDLKEIKQRLGEGEGSKKIAQLALSLL